MDEQIRHSITKMSSLHFCNAEQYRKRIIQLGEQPDKVFNVGSTGVENIKNLELMSERDVRKYLGISDSDKYAVATFHPVTLENDTADHQIKEVLIACSKKKDTVFVF